MSGRRGEPRLLDPATHSRRYVSVRTAAKYLEVDERTLRKYLDAELLECLVVGARRKIDVADLAAFEQRQRVGRRGER